MGHEPSQTLGLRFCCHLFMALMRDLGTGPRRFGGWFAPGGFGHHQSGHFFTERKGMVGSEEPMVTRVEVEKQFSDFEKHIFFLSMI